MWSRTGGKLVYERQGLIGRHLDSCCTDALAVVYAWFSRELTCLDRRLDADGVEKKGTESEHFSYERQNESYQRSRRAQIVLGPLAASDRRKPTTSQAL